jgi:multiple antibiotic resistance protein
MILLTFDTLILIFAALFPIINPPGTSLIFYSVTRRATHADRAEAAKRVAIYSFIVVNISFYIGAYVLQFFGISIPVLRVAGGVVVTMAAWKLLNASVGDADDQEDLKKPTKGADLIKSSFYPLTMPLTTGPGTIAVTIALGAGRTPGDLPHLIPVLLGTTLATFLIAAIIYVCYRFADRVETAMGETASDAIARLFAFILMCIGISILWSGLSELILQLRK